jgi:hypothetical protein
MRWSWMRISGRMDENSSGLILRLWKDNSLLFTPFTVTK